MIGMVHIMVYIKDIIEGRMLIGSKSVATSHR